MRKWKLLTRYHLSGLAVIGALGLSLATMPGMASATESSAELSIDVPTKLGLTISSDSQQCAGEAANSLCLDWTNNMTAKGTQSVTVASNNATGYTLTVDIGDGKLHPTKSGVDDTISLEVSPESFRTSIFDETKTYDFKYEARTSIVKSRVAAGDYVANVVYTVTANDAYGNTMADEKCDPASNPTACQYEFAYTGNVQKFTAPYAGKYKLEVWGASGGMPGVIGGSAYSKVGEGSGGYGVGTISLSAGDELYISAGGKGENGSPRTSTSRDDFTYPVGGWNGGGMGGAPSFSSYYGDLPDGSAGGGATSIQSSLVGDGQLKNYSSKRDDVAIVAGGGGGIMILVELSGNGAGGGFVGHMGEASVNNSSCQHIHNVFVGGSQSDGYAFGIGQDGAKESQAASNAAEGKPGAGGGWYGGFTQAGIGSCSNTYAGGGGSGYLKSTLLDISSSELKHMAGYGVETSDDAATRTISVTCAKEKPIADCAKFGNGYARITYLGGN